MTFEEDFPSLEGWVLCYDNSKNMVLLSKDKIEDSLLDKKKVGEALARLYDSLPPKNDGEYMSKFKSAFRKCRMELKLIDQFIKPQYGGGGKK